MKGSFTSMPKKQNYNYSDNQNLHPNSIYGDQDNTRYNFRSNSQIINSGTSQSNYPFNVNSPQQKNSREEIVNSRINTFSHTTTSTNRIEITGFNPEWIRNIFQIFSSYGQIINYFYQQGANWMIIEYSNPIEAQDAFNRFNCNETSTDFQVSLTYENRPLIQYTSTTDNHKISIPRSTFLQKFVSSIFSW